LAAFFGDASFALIVAAAASLWVLARQKGMSLAQLAKPAQEAIQSAGMIILITAGGGAFGGMLVLAGVGDLFGQLASTSGVSYLWLGFGVAVLLRVAQGSATVAMITVASILAPIMVASPPDYHPVYVLMATGGGSLVGNWMNNSGFWVFTTMTGLTEVEGLKTVTGSSAVLGTMGAVVAWIGSILFPLV
jgi:GntP family gluconate:H+ symporter